MSIVSKRSREGYLLIDNRFGPGVSQEFINALPPDKRGPAVGEGGMYEAPTLTCSHCHQQMVLNPMRTRERPYCPKCDRYVCDRCEVVRVVSGECNPLNAVLDRLQNEAVHLIGKG